MGKKLALLGGRKIRHDDYVEVAIIGSEERKRIGQVLKSGILSGFIARAGDCFLGGKQVKELEGLIRKYFGVKFVVSVNSATAGLHVALGACGIGPGDEAIVPPYTMSASATAIIMQNAVPVFADIDEDTFCISPDSIEKKITPRTKAIVVVHLFGYPADMSRIMKIAKKHDLFVIEDSAQAPGAVYKGRLTGTIGDIGVFSLNQHKTITSGEGGFAVTNNKKLALRMQLMRNHGEVIVDSMGVKDIDNIVGFNYRMTELEAAVAVGQFRRLDSLNEHRIKLAEYLTRELSKFEWLKPPKTEKSNKHVYFSYAARFDSAKIGVSRDLFVKALNAEGIPFGTGYVRPIYMEPIYKKKIGYGKEGCPFKCGFYKGSVEYRKGDCPVCERVYEKELILTSVCRHPHTKKDIDDVIAAFKKIQSNLEELKAVEK